MIMERVRHDGSIHRTHVILNPIREIQISPTYYTKYHSLGEGYSILTRILYAQNHKQLYNKMPASFTFSAQEWENQGGE